MASQISNAANTRAGLCEKLNRIAGGSLDYNSWRSLISEIETAFPDDIEIISLAYDSFLSAFPLCHWHLEKYAHHKAKLAGADEAIKIYDRVVGAAMYSVGFWVDYFTFVATCFEDPEDVRRLFGRALPFVAKDYFCHVLWDKYMKHEFDHEGWSFLAESYIQALRFPTKKLHFYFDNFKQFVANLEEEMEYEKNHNIEVDQISASSAIEISRNEISLIIKDLLDSSDRSVKFKAVGRYRLIGEAFYNKACQMDEQLKRFEMNIHRRYFSVIPLNDDELNNWHLYLDFIEKQDDLDWAVNLYERCLIPCANYPEFWMRYVEFLESKGGRELALSALDRATQIFLKNVLDIHLFTSRFKEQIGDVDGARAALLLHDVKTDSSFIEYVAAQANMERRLGNYAAACATYEKAIKKVAEKRKLQSLPRLYSQFAHLTFLRTGNAEAAMDVLIDGLRHVPRCRFLLETLIKFAMAHGAKHMNAVDSIISNAISPGLDESEGLNVKDREDISCLFLEFVNLCGTVQNARKAWDRHIKKFPQFLRTRIPYKPSIPGNYLDVVSKSKNQLFGLPVQLQVQEQVPEFPFNRGIQSDHVLENQLPEKDQEKNTEVVVFSNKNESSEIEPAHELSCQSREDRWERMCAGSELAGLPKENALSSPNSDHDLPCQSRGGKTAPVDVCAELSNQSEENALSPRESAHAVGKSSNANGSLDSISVHYQEKEHLEVVPMSCDESGVSTAGKSRELVISNVNDQILAGPEGTQTIESPQLRTEPGGDGSDGCPCITPRQTHADPEETSTTRGDSVQIDHMVAAPGHEDSRFHEHKQDKEQTCGKSELGAVEEAKAMNEARPNQSPLSPSPVPYPQDNMKQITLQTSQHPWQTNQNLDVNQMLQYYYHQQYQQQQQQQLIRQPYLQQQHYMNQQAYQGQLQQQHIHPVHQQQLQQQHHHQQNEHLTGQYHQSQELSYQAHQYQQLLLQQYQQYQQSVQHLQYQQQIQPGNAYTQAQHVNQHSSQNQVDEQLQQQHQEAVSKQNKNQNQQAHVLQGPKGGLQDYDGAAERSVSPQLHVQSPQNLQ